MQRQVRPIIGFNSKELKQYAQAFPSTSEQYTALNQTQEGDVELSDDKAPDTPMADTDRVDAVLAMNYFRFEKPVYYGTKEGLLETIEKFKKLYEESQGQKRETRRLILKELRRFKMLYVHPNTKYIPKTTDYKPQTENQPQPVAAQDPWKEPPINSNSLVQAMKGLLPAGVPRSFLSQQQSIGAIQPQSFDPNTAAALNLGAVLSMFNQSMAQPMPMQMPPTQIQPTQMPPTQMQPMPTQPMPYNQMQPPTSQSTYPVQQNSGPVFELNTPISVNTNIVTNTSQAYSPTESYNENAETPELESQGVQAGQKRLSAFQRLGPVEQPKKPKLTINLNVSNEQSVREVVDETAAPLEDGEDKFTPVHLRPEVVDSKDEIVMRYLKLWPWKKDFVIRKNATARVSKSVMMMELEQMDEYYEKGNFFIQVTVKGYPPTWTKEELLDVLQDCLRGRSLIPCFINFTQDECKFLTMRCKEAFNFIHKSAFCLRHGNVQLFITLSLTDLTAITLDFIPKLVLRKKLNYCYDGERILNLEAFTLGPDISNFIYFPLHMHKNQVELRQINVVNWDYLTDINLSRNKLTSIDGFNLPTLCPRLKRLDLSFNYLDKVTILLPYRYLSLHSLKLEGNPLCHDFIDPDRYVKVVRMMFPSLRFLDDVLVKLEGGMPLIKQNYCPEECSSVVEKFLEVYFPLLNLPPEERMDIQNMYDKGAVLTITSRKKLRYGAVHRYFRNLFLRNRVLEEGETDFIEGAVSIGKHMCKWPMFEHDPTTFTVDVLHHSENTIILRVAGILKLTAESLAEDENLLAFTKTFVLGTNDEIEYKIHNQMVYWDFVTEESSNRAFQINVARYKKISLRLDSAPDDDLKEKLIGLFIKVTGMEKDACEKCLEKKNWHFRDALEHFVKLLKLDSISTI